MTISNTLNGCCSCYNYTRAENPIKNITHTWYLPSGGKTHLIRHDDKIEFLNIQGKEKTSTFTNLADIPTVFSSPEEFIEFMIEMDPIFDANGKLEFTDTEKLHVWKVKYENPVELVTAVNELYLKTMSDKVTVLRKFSASDELLLEEQVSWAKERYPHVYGQKDSCKFSFEEKIKERKSAIDKKTLIDMDHWCVTMFNSDTSGIWEAYLPCTWMGHALLVVETIEEGNYFARQIDLVKDQEGDANVRLFELPKHLTERYVKNYAKSETHRRPKEDIQRMIDQIWRKVCNQKEGNPSVFF
ncbi:hypothetical protein [Candidatus Rhabdochlamydia sp. T3358]|uniref:hypothetical protein n=1 Tax=Candidatus Rhabdochlamydia sp. T3358 TaxID=2099795 RepID=UPI0010AF9CDC|nr:hypothetical protein [Candidatus Rhabdochlamydia sp. T3358]VHN99716.1 hypothetical protein RHT_00120 [Candidatus Rhabdochlamydia sp. T3358]